MCLTGLQRSFNKHNDVMGSSFFTALGFLFIRTAELLCGAETFLPEPRKPLNSLPNCFPQSAPPPHAQFMFGDLPHNKYYCDIKLETSPLTGEAFMLSEKCCSCRNSSMCVHIYLIKQITPTSVSNKFQLQHEALLF